MIVPPQDCSCVVILFVEIKEEHLEVTILAELFQNVCLYLFVKRSYLLFVTNIQRFHNTSFVFKM